MKLDTNFKYLGIAPVDSIVTLCDSILTEKNWLEWTKRQDAYSTHSRTQSIPLIWPIDNEKLETIVNTKWYPQYIEYFEPTINYLRDEILINSSSKIVRLVLTRLDPFSEIPIHTDLGHALQSVHRCHIAIVTNADSIFTIGGEEKQMTVGEVWEINNTIPHQFENKGTTSRIHLMIDWTRNV
jgi:quercetin dioxygenase-like cupin family protein